MAPWSILVLYYTKTYQWGLAPVIGFGLAPVIGQAIEALMVSTIYFTSSSLT